MGEDYNNVTGRHSRLCNLSNVSGSHTKLSRFTSAMYNASGIHQEWAPLVMHDARLHMTSSLCHGTAPSPDTIGRKNQAGLSSRPAIKVTCRQGVSSAGHCSLGGALLQSSWVRYKWLEPLQHTAQVTLFLEIVAAGEQKAGC